MKFSRDYVITSYSIHYTKLYDEEKRKENVITENTKVLVVARAGSIKPGLYYGKIKDLIKHDFGTPLHCVIIPGKLHFMEEDALKYLFENI